MKLRNLLLLTALLAICAAVASAADVTGKWTAQVPGRNGNTMEMTFQLKQDGGNLTGTVTTRRGDLPIADGKVNGDDISFTQTFEGQNGTMKILYKGKVNGDQIEFTREREGGQGNVAKFTAKKAS